jgi:hypothetical protein
MVNLFKFVSIYVIPLFILIPIITGIIKYKSLSFPLKLIFFLLPIYEGITVIESVQMIHHQQSKIYVDITSFIDFPVLSAFYILILNRKWKIPILIAAVAFALFWIADLFIEANSAMNSYPVMVENIFVMLYAIIYMNEQTKANIEASWGENSYNWINSGFFIYIASTLLLFAFYPLILKMHLNMTIFMMLFIINDAALLLQYILIAIGFNKCRQ